MGKPQCSQHDEEIVLGDAELDMLPFGRHGPTLGRYNLLRSEDVLAWMAIEDAAAIDPGAKIGGNGHIGRRRDDAIRQQAVLAGKLPQNAAKGLLGAHAVAFRPWQSG